MQNYYLHKGETFFGDECVAVGPLKLADGVQGGDQLAETLQDVHVRDGQQFLAHHEDCLLRKRKDKKGPRNCGKYLFTSSRGWASSYRESLMCETASLCSSLLRNE